MDKNIDTNSEADRTSSKFYSKGLLSISRKWFFYPGYFMAAVVLTFTAQRLLTSLSFNSGKSYTLAEDADIQLAKEKLNKEIRSLDTRLDRKIPSSYFIVINTSSNIFSLYKGKTLVKQDKCSTGSYILLKNGDAQQWLFKTPRGEFRVQGKLTSPVWRKPDWAFVEEGLPVPPANHPSRYERGVLGDYAMSLGDGYLIHGTLYQRFLGLPVTHGCIRLNDENLELVYNSLQKGSKVFIF
jgi:L,D-transpeptidase YbiS